MQEVLGVLAEEGFVHHADGQWNWTSESYPADAVSLRSVSSDNFVVVDITHGERVIGETDFTSGPRRCTRRRSTSSKGSCSRSSGSTSTAARPTSASVECDYYTDAIIYTKVTILDTFDVDGPGLADGCE